LIVQNYGAILIDPPWAFRTFSGKDGIPKRGHNGAANYYYYSTMSMDELKRLPVGFNAADNCALFMWVVDSHFPEALALGEAWGFGFKTCAFVWSKGKIGMGYWTRKQTEQCWLFTRGKPSRLSKAVRQVIEAPRREHSRKPDEQYERIEALVGGPYLEMFARQRRPGWDVWGDETDKFPSAASVLE
jgi:N6-adenosine-specific RNA methylase IME4